MYLYTLKFQSTLPRRERHGVTVSELSDYYNFNPRSREGSDIFIQHLLYYPFLISIHAPAKGATYFIKETDKTYKISIHAPAKGATDSDFYFQNVSHISIHAPAKGATIKSGGNVLEGLHFNPRSREGSDR